MVNMIWEKQDHSFHVVTTCMRLKAEMRSMIIA